MQGIPGGSASWSRGSGVHLDPLKLGDPDGELKPYIILRHLDVESKGWDRPAGGRGSLDFVLEFYRGYVGNFLEAKLVIVSAPAPSIRRGKQK